MLSEYTTKAESALLQELDGDGYAVIEDLPDQAAAMGVVQSIGSLIPQYHGASTHEVTYRAGNDDRAYSQSANTIRAHTEAPGWNPSPAYLALFCHRQASCGGGHTDLLDVRRVVEHLDAAEIALLTSAELHFPGPAEGITTTMVGSAADGRQITRFSYNLLTAGDYDPVLDDRVDASLLPLGEAGRQLADHVSAIFQEHRTSVLIPENALLIWDNQRMMHARSAYTDKARHLTRFWCADGRRG